MLTLSVFVWYIRFMYKKTTICAIAIAIFAVPLLVSANPNANVEATVRVSFPDMPEMIGIAKCESGFRQFNADGTVLRGGAGKQYLGIFQFSESIHVPKAQSMAYDLYTVEGNIAYARHVYRTSGTNPWKACAGTPAPAVAVPAAPSSPSVSGSITSNLNFGMSHSQVVLVQKTLNANGYTVSVSGPGSPGNETSYFGSLTREAVKRFQCSKGIVCSGTESSTGYGRVGPMTRSALNQLAR
jgi:hypothetical protein